MKKKFPKVKQKKPVPKSSPFAPFNPSLFFPILLSVAGGECQVKLTAFVILSPSTALRMNSSKNLVVRQDCWH